MNLSHLKYVLEVGKTNSITRAAHNLYMGQPNLSKAIKELESEIGITIFKRTAQGVQPTRKGKEFLEYASTILSQVNELESMYKRPFPGESVEFAFSVPRATYLSVAAARLIAEYSDKPHMEIYFKETSSMGAINDVAAGESDFGIVRYQSIHEEYFLNSVQDRGLQQELIRQFTTQLLMSKDHPLASYENISFHMLSGYPEIVQGDIKVPSVPLSQIQKGAGFDAHAKRIYVYDRGSQYDILQRVPGSYMWTSPISKDYLEQRGLVMKKCLLSSLMHKDIIIYPKGEPLAQPGRRFVELLQQIAGET